MMYKNVYKNVFEKRMTDADMDGEVAMEKGLVLSDP